MLITSWTSKSRHLRSGTILGSGYCYVGLHGDQNKACLIEIEAGLCNPASISVELTCSSTYTLLGTHCINQFELNTVLFA